MAKSKSKQRKPAQFYQGDIMFLAVPRSEIPAKLTYIEPEGDRLIYARGEVTGHHHSIPASAGRIGLDEGGTMWATIEELTATDHQEHAPRPLPPGAYRIGAPGMRGCQRQWTDDMEPIRVSD